MWAAITRSSSSSPRCQHLRALTNLWALEGGRGLWRGAKDGVPRAGLLQFNKCHCRALCQLQKQLAIPVLCIFHPSIHPLFGAKCIISTTLDLCRSSLFNIRTWKLPKQLLFETRYTSGSLSLYLSGGCRIYNTIKWDFNTFVWYISQCQHDKRLLELL